MRDTAIRRAALLAALSVGALMTRDASGALPAPMASASKRNADQVATRLSEMRERKDLRRAVTEAPVIDKEARTVDLSFSSTTEVRRWFGVEILSHAPGAMRTERLNASAPFLWMHNWDDQRGVVVPGSVRLDGNKGRATVKLSRTQPGEDLFLDMQDNVRPNVSVGYRIHDAQLIEVRDDDVEVWLITDWEPYEISSVSVPADVDVGMGRTAEKPQEETRAASSQNPQHPQSVVTRTEPQPRKPDTMNEKVLRDGQGNLVRAQVDESGAIVKVLEVLERAGDDVAAHLRTGTQNEQRRVRALLDMGDKFGKAVPDAAQRAAAAIRDGKTPEQFQGELAEALNERASKPLSEQSRDLDVGMTDKEVERFSFVRAIMAADPRASNAVRQAAAFEIEASRAAAQKYGRDAKGIMVPIDVLRRPHEGMARAAMSTMNQPGQHLVANTTLWGSFIDALRNRTTIMKLGTVLGGLQGTIDIPKQTSDGQGYWVGEAENAPETGFTLGQIAMSPKTVAAYSDMTRRLLMQSSPDIEGLVRMDLVRALGNTIDVAGYYGKGTDKQPRGLKNFDGINGVDFAAQGAPTFPELVKMETEVAADNADLGAMAYVGHTRFRGHCKTTLKFAGVGAGTIWEQGNTVNGYRTEITNQVSADDVFFGNFADLIIAMWGGLDLTVDPAALALSGGLRVIAFQDVDFNLRREESLCWGSHLVA